MNPKPIKDAEWFERKWGGWFAGLSAIMLPVPFVGFFSLLQFVTIVVIGMIYGYVLNVQSTTDGNDFYYLAARVSFVYLITAVVFLMTGIYGLFKWSNYKKMSAWIRILCYILAILINGMYVYIVFIQGEYQPRF